MIKLRDYQEEAIQFSRSRRFSYLGIPPGGGKTVTALYATEYQDTILIVAPSSLLMMWSDEIKRFFPLENPLIIKKPKDLINCSARYILISYDKLLRMDYYTPLTKIEYTAVIVDEAHYIKNHTSRRAQALMSYVDDGKRRLMTRRSVTQGILLSGTPIMQRPVEIYSAIRGLRPDLMGQYADFKEFAIHFCEAYETKVKVYDSETRSYREITRFVTNGASHLKELSNMLKDLLFYVPKSLVYGSLPPLTEKIVRFDVAQNLVKQSQLDYDINNLVDQDISIPFNLYAKLQYDFGIEKIGVSAEYINSLLAQDQKVLIFCNHLDVIEGISNKLKHQHFVLDGSVKPDTKDKIKKIFATDQNIRALVCQFKAVGLGLDFNTAHHVVFVEYDWNPGVIEQCYKRVHRGDIKHSVIVHYLVVSGSLDDIKLTNVMEKELVVDEFNNYMRVA